MASGPPTPPSPPASNSPLQPNTNPLPQAQGEEAAVSNGVDNNVDENKPATIDELHTADHIKKFRKYEADYTRWLTAKYFSEKTLYGGDIFDRSVTIQDEVIKSSRWPCTRSYADPVQGFEDHIGSSSTSVTPAEASPKLSNGKHPVS